MEEKKGICWRSFGIGAGAGIGACLIYGGVKKLIARVKAGKEAEKAQAETKEETKKESKKESTK